MLWLHLPVQASPSRKSRIHEIIFTKLSGMWLSRGSYGIYVAVTGSTSDCFFCAKSPCIAESVTGALCFEAIFSLNFSLTGKWDFFHDHQCSRITRNPINLWYHDYTKEILRNKMALYSLPWSQPLGGVACYENGSKTFDLLLLHHLPQFLKDRKNMDFPWTSHENGLQLKDLHLGKIPGWGYSLWRFSNRTHDSTTSTRFSVKICKFATH